MSRPKPTSRSALILGAGLCAAVIAWLSPAASARAPEASPITQTARMAELLGSIHYLQLTCATRDQQMWRERMMRLLELEAPQAGPRRERLVRAFNAGYTTEERRTPSCGGAPEARRRLSAEGRRVAESLRGLYVQ